MAKHHRLELSASETQSLVELRDKGEPAYLRERATAILKIHAGFSPHEVARSRLLKPRAPDTVYAWLRRYRGHGIRGLFNRPGRGRKPAFSPKSPEEAESEVLAAIGGPVEEINPHQTRWTLPTLGQVVPWLRDICVSGAHQIPSRLGISYKRTRDYVRSPDADYAEKLSRVEQVFAETCEQPETHVVVYQDEFRFYLQPTLSKDCTETSTKTPLARQSYLSQEMCYGIGALNPIKF